MLNLRKLKQDYSSNVLKEGKDLFDQGKVISAKILHIDPETLRIGAQVLGQYKNAYESEIEIDRMECETVDSDCDCPYHYDCQHLAALLHYLEAHLDEILVKYSKEADLEEHEEEIIEVVKEAETKEVARKDEQRQKELLDEYVVASKVLGTSPFFLPREERRVDRAELAVLFSFPKGNKPYVDFQLALRLPSRSKPLHIPNVKGFLDAARHLEPLVIGGKEYYFTIDSFSPNEQVIASSIMDHARGDPGAKVAHLDLKIFGMLLAQGFEVASKGLMVESEDLPTLPCLYEESLDKPLKFSTVPATLEVHLETIEYPEPKVLLNPHARVDQKSIMLEEVRFFECAMPGVLYNHVYHRFPDNITRQHLRALLPMRNMTIPEPLFGTFIENSMPELSGFAEIHNQKVIESFVTLPYVGNLSAICDLSFLNGELEAALQFDYDGILIPASHGKLTIEHLDAFSSPEGIVARNLVEEQKIIEDLFRDFIFDQEHELFVAKTEKKIIEFMTDTIPRNQERVHFNCPQNLLDQFIYDDSEFKLSLKETEQMDVYQMKIDVKGSLKGIKVDRVWDCIVSKRSYLEVQKGGKISKILVLDLERIGQIVQLFDELGIEKLDNHTIKRPIWSIANIDASNFKDLPVKFTMSAKLKEIRAQMLGEKNFEFSKVPVKVQADLRNYQMEGVHWLERLRSMFLSGILADDMGLGKTLQAIVAIAQLRKKTDPPALIVCPTSLLYNWKEEMSKFMPEFRVLVIDGMPGQRRDLIETVRKYDVVVTSYSLIQKDVEHYQSITFSYMVLDEAQHIKNRGTRNAKSVKQIKSKHKVILSGTPIENSLDELWSLFDFLMPGFLSSYDRFIEKYVRVSSKDHSRNLTYLKKKVAPFILRRMKTDVLDDLPPVSEINYRCQLSPVQQELYKSYAQSARDELVKLVERDGFDKVQIHVLATLTRLKQICCHPAIFAKETREEGDSAKYDMLLELLGTLIEGNHKTVIFSQYTRMLQIMREDFEARGIRFAYLDGSSKNRLDIVNEFNNDPDLPVFLVSLKAGGTGLNLVGADTVIHYDMWWNPAVENQATDRVHRIGQNKQVSVYKLVTLGTIEEKIVEMHDRKKGIVKKIVSCDDEAITKLTWEDVLELLQT
ncbi:MAG: RNA polymerase-associated protein RapA [Chlamydiia bacterium]|nr:RNA polymerase-associated protein RapA [Chlamydiia bacterium]MCH9616675.1 RNA polymerase-associated protein RapA [Chlamydiia bacterium]MCH9629406.1 RNA polymerase-associated protein RapA [Chlamydiia bacterium]